MVIIEVRDNNNQNIVDFACYLAFTNFIINYAFQINIGIIIYNQVSKYLYQIWDISAILVILACLYNKFRFDKIETDVANLKTDVAEMKTDVAEMKTDVAEMKTDVAEMKTDVAEMKTDVAELKHMVFGLNTKFDILIAQLAAK